MGISVTKSEPPNEPTLPQRQAFVEDDARITNRSHLLVIVSVVEKTVPHPASVAASTDIFRTVVSNVERPSESHV